MAETWTSRSTPACAATCAMSAAPLLLHHLEALPAGLVKDADEVDDAERACHRPLHRRTVADIALHDGDLADEPPDRREVLRELGPARHRDHR